MIAARGLITLSEDKGQWIRGRITPQMIKRFLHDRDRAWQIDDRSIARHAEQGSLLALTAIHEGIWSDASAIATFMSLQSIAIRTNDRLDPHQEGTILTNSPDRTDDHHRQPIHSRIPAKPR